MKQGRLIRSATLRGYVEAARQVGLDAEAMLAEVGLSAKDADATDKMISLDAFLALLANSAQRSGCHDFGIRAAAARGIPDLGPVTLLMREADDVEAAIRLFTSHLRLHADGTTVQLDTRFDDPIVIIDVQANTKLESIQATQFSVTGILKQIRWLIGEEYRPALVCFSFAKPADTRLAHSIFQCDVRYGQILSGVVLDRKLLRRPLVTSTPFLRKLALQHLRPMLMRDPDAFSSKVSRLIRADLADGDCSSEAIADKLAIDRRTLNRRLAQEGKTYSSLLQSVRTEAVQTGLDNPNESLTELAGAAGFRSLSAFSRWFQSTFGCSATEWRVRSRRKFSEDGPQP